MARCSRHHRILAAAPFAWIGADPITVKINTGVDGTQLPSCPLLRVIPTHLVWAGPAESLASQVHTFLAVVGRAHVVALTVHLYRLDLMDDALAGQLMQDPSLQRLQSLTLWSHTRRLIELACQLPLLATLTLESRLHEADAPLLSTAPALIDLSVADPESDSGCVPLVLQCPKLRRLAVSGFWVTDLPSFSAGLGWPQLRELSISPHSGWGQVLPEQSNAIAAAFSSLQSILVLTLAGENLDPLLAHVHRIPTLRRLVIDCSGWGVSLHCSDAALRSLLRSSPSLIVEWSISPGGSERLKSLLRPLVAGSGGKLRLIEEVSPQGQPSRLRLMHDA